MKTKFGLVFNERDDGTKVWSAECQGCGTVLVGEWYPQVTVIGVKEGSSPLSAADFSSLIKQSSATWDRARKTGSPVILGDDRFEIKSTHDHGDLQRALEAHAEKCASGRSRQPDG
jgi:hypothetical protein